MKKNKILLTQQIDELAASSEITDKEKQELKQLFLTAQENIDKNSENINQKIWLILNYIENLWRQIQTEERISKFLWDQKDFYLK